MTQIEIRKRITTTDKHTLANLFGCSWRYVEYVIRGERRNAEILKMAEKLITEREKLTEALKKELQDNNQ